jgi:type IV secretory pathway VirB10-like protein
MMQQPQHTPIAKPRRPVVVRRSLVALVLAGVLGVVAYALMDSDDPGQQPVQPAQATTMKPQLAGVVAELPQGYRELPPDEPPAPPAEKPPEEPKAPPKDSGTQPQGGGQAKTTQTPARQTATRQGQPKPTGPPRWLIAKGNVQKPPFERPKLAAPAQEELALLKPANWVTPVHPEMVLYPEQVIPAIMLQALDSDTPGTLRFMVTENVMDLQTGTIVLIPQFSRILGFWQE